MQQPTIRSNFADTAYWAGAITTSPEGVAEVRFKMPESLTGWKVKTWAMGLGTKVGQGETEVTTKKNLLVRLQAPRFFVDKDEVVISANVHSYLKTEKQVEVALEIDGKLLSILAPGDAPPWVKEVTQTIMLAAGGTKRLADWELTGRVTKSYDDYERAFEQMTGRRLGGIGFLIDATRSRETPALRPTYGDADALNQYTANQWVYNKSIYNADEEITTGSLDVKRAFESARTPFQLQGGIKYQKQDRETETWLPSWTYVGSAGVLNVAQFGQAERGYGMRHGFYPAFQLLDFRPANALLNSQPGQFTPVGTSVAVRNPPSAATEEISSAYVMGKVDVRPFSLLGGVRAERTEIAARGAFTRAGGVSTTSREGPAYWT